MTVRNFFYLTCAKDARFHIWFFLVNLFSLSLSIDGFINETRCFMVYFSFFCIHGHVFPLKIDLLRGVYLLRVCVPSDNQCWNFQTIDSVIVVFLRICSNKNKNFNSAGPFNWFFSWSYAKECISPFCFCRSQKQTFRPALYCTRLLLQ